MNKVQKEIYEVPKAEIWVMKTSLNLLDSLSTDLYLEGDIDGYEEIEDY